MCHDAPLANAIGVGQVVKRSATVSLYATSRPSSNLNRESETASTELCFASSLSYRANLAIVFDGGCVGPFDTLPLLCEPQSRR